MLVYWQTGIGTIWTIGKYETLIRIEEIHLIPLMTLEVDDVLNVIMTMPLGFLLPLIWKELRSAKKIILIGFCFSLAIELSQLLNRRATTTDDLIMNTLGVMIGYFIFMFLYDLFYKNDTIKEKNHFSVPIVRNEAVIYLILSFAGMFFLYNPWFLLKLLLVK